MAISKSFATALCSNSGVDTGLTSGTFDSTGFTHILLSTKHEGASATITPSDNKGSSGWASGTKQGNSLNDSWIQFHWAAIGSPGTGHTATMAFGASRTFRTIGVWLINSDSGSITLDVQSVASGSNNTPDAGSLVTSAAAVLFMAVAEYAGVNYTAGTGWTEDYDNPADTSCFSFGESRTEASSGTFDPSCTATNTQEWAAASVAFIESGGGAAGQPYIKRVGGVPFMGGRRGGLWAPANDQFYARRRSGIFVPRSYLEAA